MDEQELYNPLNFRQLVGRLKELETLLRRVQDKDTVRRISRHDVLVRGELNDLDTIWRRFLRSRQELIDLEFEGLLDCDQGHGVTARERDLSNTLKVDLKSLFLFGDILFNKLVLLVRAVVGPKRGIEYRSFSSFLKSIRKLAGRGSESWESRLYQRLGEDLERIEVLLGFYRDKFIVHVSGPYQEGIVRSVYLPEIRLDHTSWKLAKFDLKKFMVLVKQLGDIIPENDKYGRPIGKPSDPRPKVEALFANLHRIRDPNLRERAEGYIRSVGMGTPDIYRLVAAMTDAALGIIASLATYIEQHYAEA